MSHRIKVTGVHAPGRTVKRKRTSRALMGLMALLLSLVMVGAACTPAPPPPGSSGGYNLQNPSVTGNLGFYRIQLVYSSGINRFIDDVEAVANELNAIVGRQAFSVDAGFISSLTPERGIIKIKSVGTLSPVEYCPLPLTDMLSLVGQACPIGAETRFGKTYWTAGQVELLNTMTPCSERAVVRHEIAHTLGLEHFDYSYQGSLQTMHNTVQGQCGLPGYQAGDVNGLRYLDSNRPVSALKSSNFGDSWCNDIVARKGTELFLYPGDCAGNIQSGPKIGVGWTSDLDLIVAADLNNDGCGDLIARRASTGKLLDYESNCAGTFKTPKEIGFGWHASSIDAIFSGDLNGDGCDDITARRSDTNTLWLYRGNCDGTFKTKMQIGTGWGPQFQDLHSSDTNNDGCMDVVTRDTSTNQLKSYRGNCNGTLLSPVTLSGYWSSTNLTPILSKDLTGDGCADIITRRVSDSKLFMYRSTCSAASSYTGPIEIGHGWSQSQIDKII